jgi:predicted  nucleic acid-binding Zn-ribbon protein
MDLAHEQRLTAVESQCRTNAENIEALEKRQDALDSLTAAVAAHSVRVERVEKDVKEIKVDVKNIAARPASMWEKVVATSVSVIVGAVLGYIFSSIGLS